MTEYLVEITTTVPEGTGDDEVEMRKAAEAARAKELTAQGSLVRLWRPAGEMRSIGLWRAANETELRDNVLGTLPLRPWMTISITPLDAHPNDPGRQDGAA